MKKIILSSLCVGFLLTACTSVNESEDITNVKVSFAKANETAGENTTVSLKFSEPTMASGSVTISVEEQNVTYGADYTLSPEKSGSSITIDYQKGVSSVDFTFHKITDALPNENRSVTFTITSISDSTVEISGLNKTVVSYNPMASQGTSIELNVGGSTMPNQSFLNLSEEIETSVPRDNWDLAFYNGNEFRVKINGSIKMAVKKLNTTDITEVVTADPSVAVGTFDPANIEFVDAPSGDLNGTAIEAISANDNENHVYLVNMGAEVPTTPAQPGSVNTAGASRGWMKIKINRNGTNGYKLMYAPIDATTYNEATIDKNATYNFSFFNMSNNSQIEVAPAKDAWDIQYCTFTNDIDGAGSYFFSDFIIINRWAGVKAYMVQGDYSEFTASDINEGNFETDQRAIGASWRSVMPIELKTNIFYVVKDTEGNYYKLKITQFQNPSTEERGFPIIEYKKL